MSLAEPGRRNDLASASTSGWVTHPSPHPHSRSATHTTAVIVPSVTTARAVAGMESKLPGRSRMLRSVSRLPRTTARCGGGWVLDKRGADRRNNRGRASSRSYLHAGSGAGALGGRGCGRSAAFPTRRAAAPPRSTISTCGSVSSAPAVAITYTSAESPPPRRNV